MNISQWKQADRRKDPRGHLQLRLAVIYPQREAHSDRPVFYGKTRDISLTGLSIVVDHNLYQEGEVIVVLALPSSSAEAARKAVTCAAEMTYAVYVSKLRAYKIGLAFRKFKGDGKGLLEEALRHALIEEGIADSQLPRGHYSALRSHSSTSTLG